MTELKEVTLLLTAKEFDLLYSFQMSKIRTGIRPTEETVIEAMEFMRDTQVAT